MWLSIELMWTSWKDWMTKGMRIDILSIFPDMFGPLNQSIVGKAQDKGILELILFY